MMQKMMEKEKEAEPAAHQTSAMAPMKPANSSVAAKRQAKAQAKKSISFGPSDEEIAGILEVGRTPTPPMQQQAPFHTFDNKPSTMEMKNGKKEAAASGFNLGGHSEQDSRAAFLESQKTAA